MSQDESDRSEKSENLERYSFTLSTTLIEEIGKIGESLKMNRSMVVREALSNWIIENTKKLNLKGDGIGITSYMYNHHDSRVVSELMSTQHDFEDVISSTTHIHLDHQRCLENVISKGVLVKIKELNDNLRNIKGISFFSDLLIPKMQ